MGSFIEFTFSPRQLHDRQVVVHEVTDQRGFFAIQSIFEGVRRRMPQGIEPQICIEGENGKVYVEPDGNVYTPADETQFTSLGTINLTEVRVAIGAALTLPLQTETGRRDLPLGCVTIIQVSPRN